MQSEQVEKNRTASWSFVCHLDYGGRGAVCRVVQDQGGISIRAVKCAPAVDAAHPPVFLGLDEEERVFLMDPESKAISRVEACPENAFAPYAYREPGSDRVWFMYDGDKETGCDPLNCGDSGSSVTVVHTGGGSSDPALLDVVCVGRGHHVTTFTAPCAAFPHVPRRAFVSNLLDGSISVLGNDPEDEASYLKVLDVIDLCEPDKEKEGGAGIPNNAFPHGKVFSPVTGKIYSLNNGYGTIAVIDPAASRVERTIPLKVSSNLLLSPDGAWLIGKGADRKCDPDHVVGRLSVVDIQRGEVVTTLDLPDLYPSTYRFTPDGGRLYVTSAATGKGAQRDNLRKDVIYVYDASRLPELVQVDEITVGLADCGRRPVAFALRDGGQTAFVPNPTDGTVSIVDVGSGRVVDVARISGEAVKEFNFSFWEGNISGC